MAVQDAAIKKLLAGQIDQGVYDTQANAITGQVTDNFNTNIMPGMMSGAMSAGNYGSSRQGIAQGLAASRMNQDLGVGLAGLSGSMHNTAQNLMGTTANNLQGLDTQKAMNAANNANAYQIAQMNDATNRYGIDNQTALGWGGWANNAYANETGRMGTLGALGNTAYANETQRGLGMGNLGLNFAQLGQQGQQWNSEFDRQVYNDAYSQNANNLQTGINLLGTLNGYNQGDLNLGTMTRDAQLNYLTQFTNLNSTIGRGGQTTTTTQPQSGGNLGAAALGGAQLGNSAMNWWNSNNYGSGSNYNNGSGGNDLANLGQSNNWWGTGG